MRYNLQSFLLSGAVLVSAVGVMWLGHAMFSLQPDIMVVRKIDIAVTPPPPPPPKTHAAVQETELVMQVEGSGAAMTMADLSVEPDIHVPKPDMPNVQAAQTQWDMPDIELNAFGLSELDSKPTLLTPVKIRFPKRLKKQGIKQVMVKLDVVIDEGGNVELMDIVENPHHELNKEIVRFVKASKFTSPFKEDEAVKARFIWPVFIEA
ncbi:energy transducer TonB [Alteromonas gracilis]|uniref:energy transducer TonB n=1 Tax=Alteromonas gracilis TaxID=1479524 RepID=UPI003735D61B